MASMVNAMDMNKAKISSDDLKTRQMNPIIILQFQD